MDIQQLKQLKILVIGDYCTDIFCYGNCARLSPEAPVPILLFQDRVETDGMAGNVRNNLSAFGASIELLTTSKNIQKIRYVDSKTKQHLLRVDHEALSEEISLKNVNFSFWDAVVLSDYNKGTISEKTYNFVRKKYKGFIFVDSKKKDLSIFDGTKTIVKINDSEYNQASSLPEKSDLIVTLGSRGAMYDGGVIETEKVDIVDVSGAGDSFLAGFVIQYLLTESIEKSIRFANICATSVVKKSGTAIIDFEEVKSSLC